MMNNVFALVSEMFSYTFLVRAVIVGALVSICSALLGVSLVLKRYSMIGDGLSHVGFGALALAMALGAAPLSVAVPVVIGAAFLLLRLGEKSLIKGDAAIALIATSSLALGVIIISQTTGMNTDVCNFLFGSILAMTKNDVYLSIALSIVVLILFALFYHKLFAITFDETFARAGGVRTGAYNMLIAFLTAITIVLGMRMMGAMLISALIIFPALTSMRVFKTFKSVSICSICVSIFCFFTGIIISYLYAVPTGASVVLINITAFLLFWFINFIIKKERRLMRKMHIALCFVLVFTAACAKAEKNNGAAENVIGIKDKKNVIEIKEKMFIAQTNDVYLNSDEYVGKTLKLEGLFKRETYGNRDYCFVLRYGPGCCGSDGNAGFEVTWEKKEDAPIVWPEIDAWVSATGVFTGYEEDDATYYYLVLSELDVLDKRGAEFVSQ
jgi:zinc transport system permease protein